MQTLTINTMHEDIKLQLTGFTNGCAGPVILCLHGIQGGGVTFEPLLSNSQFDDFRIIALDLVGFGGSSKPDEFSYSIDDQAIILLSAMSAIGVSSFHILGHSLGGMIGTVILELAPSRVISFVNLEGNLMLEDCGDSRKTVELTLSEFEINFYPSLKQSQIEKGREHLARSMEMTPPKVFYKTAREIVEVSRSERLLKYIQESKVPILLLVGTAGSFHSRPKGKNLSICEIEGADHFSLSRSPSSYDAIRSFLKSLS